jgi:hypothetical protein
MTSRIFTDAEQVVFDHLWSQKQKHRDTHAFVTTTKDLTLKKWNGKHPPEENMKACPVKAGSTLKVVMVSRLGDFGLTDDLTADYGYHLRLDWTDPAITDLRFNQ